MSEREPLQELVDRNRAVRMDRVDQMSPELRKLVHEYGLNVVKALMDCGVSKPSRIRHIVETILDEFSPTRGSYSKQGLRVNVDRSPLNSTP